MSATGKQKWENLFEPKVPGFKHVPFNDIDAIRANMSSSTCAVMVEPIQGEGGVFEAQENYVKVLRQICNQKNILLIFDEVQTGIGRTGTLFAYEHYGIEPDIMTPAKGIGGGFPLAALLTKDKYNIFEPGDQGGTYSGQPLAMAVGYAVLQAIMDQDIMGNVKKQGEYLINRLKDIAADFQLTNIRGRGLLIAFDLPLDKGSEIVAGCLEDGLIINSPRPSIIRFMPPLIVKNEDIDVMIKILSENLAKVLNNC